MLSGQPGSAASVDITLANGRGEDTKESADGGSQGEKENRPSKRLPDVGESFVT